jgi:hypothetical protein
MSPHEIHVLTNWVRVFLISATVFADLFVVLYAFSPWYRSAVGRLLMLQSISLALALDITLVFHFWPPSSIWTAFWVEVMEFFLITIASCSLCILLLVYYTRTLRRRKANRHI